MTTTTTRPPTARPPAVAPRGAAAAGAPKITEAPPLRVELAAALLVPSAAVGFIRIFADGQAVLPLIGASLLSTVLAAGARRLRLPLVVSALVSFGFLVVLVTRRYAPGTGRGGTIPDGETVDALRAVLDVGIDAFRELKAPVEALDPFVAAALIACWIMAFLTDWGALRLRLAFEPVLPAGLLFIFSSVLGSGDHRMVATAIFCAAVLLWAVTQRVTDLSRHAVWLNTDRRRGPRDLAVNGLLLGVGALGLGLIAGPFLPGSEANPIYSWRNPGDPVRQVESPYVSIRAQLDELSAVRLFTVRSDRAAYWRIAGLDSYEDERWTTKGSFLEEDGELPGTLPRAGSTVTIRQTFTVEKLGAIWLPAAFAPSRIIESSAPITWNRDTESLTVDESRETSDGLTYTVESVVPLYTADELRAADGPLPPAIAQKYLTLPADLTPQVASQARQIAAGATTPYDQMLALQAHFRAYDYSLDLSPREGDPIEQFLAERVGFCQQFSATFALMARSLGVPARVAVGFTWGDPVAGEEGLYAVSGRQAHAWPEVYFTDLGWVAFEPTPGRGAPDALHNTAPAAQDSLVQPDNPGQPTTTTTRAPGAGGLEGLPLDFQPGLGLPEQGEAGATPDVVENGFPVWLVAALAATAAYLIGAPTWHRLRRARRRRRAQQPRAKIDAAWANAAESIELATGLVRPPAVTRVAWAVQLRGDARVPGDRLRELAVVVTRARYDTNREPTVQEIATANDAAAAVIRHVYQRLGWGPRWRAEIDPRRLIRPTRRDLSST